MAYHERVPVAPLRHEHVDVHELLKEAEGLIKNRLVLVQIDQQRRLEWVNSG